MESTSPASSNFFLVQSPKRWTTKHLQALRVLHRRDLEPEEMVVAKYLPQDDEPGERSPAIVLRRPLSIELQ
ncbi:MAG: hypothetical protein M1816_006911 [Peltula sp. TS41687]|nr:MAG: hypothetical protein M1816_006911 [Peltula sp. TS41687]